ncbi:VOC family protein [Nocardioides sp. DS6]|uniref:VOC family protein n=1 Tax=Nocardioides eburneus TaxID=3231482 RepID=A0ABV3SY81_9ACTN
MATRSPLATFKDLCIDAVDAGQLAAFWGAVLGLRVEERPDGMTLLVGPTPQHTVWINQVPEPVSTKQRAHLDVHAASVEDVLDLGASPYDLESFRWKVLRDPEGGELCVFEREQVPDYRLYELNVDCADPEPIATWWARVLGGKLGHEDGVPWWWVEDVPGMPFEGIVFAPVPEPKIVKNRIHWDVDTPDLAALVAAGASVVRERDDEIAWTVLADPDGNEFCAFVGE